MRHGKEEETLGKAVETVKDAALAVAHAADDHVVQPVGKVLGLVSKDAEKPKSKKTVKAARKVMVSTAEAKKQTGKKSPAAKTMSSGLKTAPKLTQKQSIESKSNRRFTG